MSSNPDLLLVNLPPWAQENPHIGIGYLSSHLADNNINFKVLDLNKSFFVNNPDFKMLWHIENKNFWSNKESFLSVLEIFNKDLEEAVSEIVTLRPKVLGFSVVDPKERLTIEFIKRIKKKLPAVKVVLGGPATSTTEQRGIFLDNIEESIDAFVVGEGEEACVELVRAIRDKKQLHNIAGTVVRSNGKWLSMPSKSIEPLEKISFPTYREFDMSLYGRSLLVEWSRGCFSRCSFCKNWRLFPVYRAKAPEWIFKELRYHNQTYGISEFTVVDSVLNGNLKQLHGICSLIIGNGLKINWSGQIAPRKEMGLDFFKHLKKAGCEKLQIGVESGSDKVLKSMRKAYTAEVSKAAVKNAKRAGIETEIFIIIGHPGEDNREFRKTYDFIKNNKSYIDAIKSINTLHLIAGTEVYEKGEQSFNLKPLPENNWHYLWESRDGNSYEVRKSRAQTLLDLAADSGIRVMETNIAEGKENISEAIKEPKDPKRSLLLLESSINSLQQLPQKREVARKRRSKFKWLILFFVCFYTFSYIVYFWFYMILRNRVLLGGRKKLS